jgi:hypothetical protein
MQSIKVDWCVVHDRQEWPVEVEDDDDRRRRPTSYGGTRRDRDDAGSGVAAPGLEHQHERNGENLSGGVARPDEEGVRCGAGTVRHIVAPRPEIYGAKTSAIRQAGLDYGYAEGYDFVLTVDDDCVLPLGWAEDHVKALGGVVPIGNNTVPGQVIRGFPSDYTLPVGISHGLWSGVLDYPAWFQLANNPGPVTIEDRGWKPVRSPFPMCGMNVGFRREVLPAVFFQHTFRRHDDIFAGWIAQAALDLHGYGYVNGGAVVRHERASDAEANLRKEAPGDLVNTALLKHVRGFQTTYMDVAGTFDKLAAHVGRLRVGNAESDRLIQEYAASMLTWQRRRR